jgi:adenosyl cobinamide kinase/adenosyl cobinamide phosphate guanylyltransferase
MQKVQELIVAVMKTELITIMVSNEVGYGLVPDNPLARRFIDLIGFTNQRIAQEADEVILMQSGIPMIIKGVSSEET